MDWYKGDDISQVFDFETPITEDTTLIAKWASELIVRFDTNGAGEIPIQIINYGEKVVKPDAPTKAGYGFAGWYSDKACKKTFDFNLGIKASMTIYAAWYKKFDDVQNAEEFFYYPVYEGAHLEFMTGYSDRNSFGPYDVMDRQTVAVALYKFAGSPGITQAQIDKEMGKFTDKNDIVSWAKEGIAWCSMTGKFTGIKNKDGTFTAAPTLKANREMIATFLWRYADEPAVKDASKFNAMPDKGQVSDWATDGMQWCMSKGIISGVEDHTTKIKYIEPFGDATRGQMITMMVRGKSDLMKP